MELESPTKTITEQEATEFQKVKKQKRKNIDRSPQNIEVESKKYRKIFPKLCMTFKEKTLLNEIETSLSEIHKDLYSLCSQKDEKTIILQPTTERELNICIQDFTDKIENLNKKFLLTNENKVFKKYAMNKIQIDISIEEINKVLKHNNIIASNIKRETNYWGTVTTLITFDSINSIENTKIEIYSETKIIRKFTPKSLQRCTRCQKLGHNYKNCKNKASCVRCSQSNCGKECNSTIRLCTNCKGNHSAAYLGCTYYKKMTEIYLAQEKEEVIKKELKLQEEKLKSQENKIKTFAECVKTINKTQKEQLENKEKINKLTAEVKFNPKDLLLILNKCFQIILALKENKHRPYLIFDCIRENFNKIFGEILTKDEMKKLINIKTTI